MSGAIPFREQSSANFSAVDVVADDLVLQIPLPVDAHGAGDMPQVVEQQVLVALHDADLRVLQVILDPVGRDQDFGVGVGFSHGP